MQTTRLTPPLVDEAIVALDHGLRRLMWLEHKRSAQNLAAHNLTVPQFVVLLKLALGKEACTIGSLASNLFQSNATMTGIIDRLENERLVVRSRGRRSDRRQVVVQVTSKGRALLERAQSARQAQIRRALVDFPVHDIEQFVRLLNTYTTELEKES